MHTAHGEEQPMWTFGIVDLQRGRVDVAVKVNRTSGLQELGESFLPSAHSQQQ